MTDPDLILDEGRLILVGHVKEMDALVSVHFEPKLSDDGHLQMDVVRAMVGSLPLPDWTWSAYKEKLSKSLTASIEKDRPKAEISRKDGTANAQAASVMMDLLLLHAFNQEPSEPVLFLPQDPVHHRWLPVKVTAISIKDKTLSLTVESLTPEYREVLRQKIRDINAQSASGSAGGDSGEPKGHAEGRDAQRPAPGVGLIVPVTVR